MSKEINESNFKVLCLKDDNHEDKPYFFKEEVLECKKGYVYWKGKENSMTFGNYKSYKDFIERWSFAFDKSYFKLIEVDGQPVNKEDENNIQQQNTNSKQFEKLWDSGIVNTNLITLNWGDEEQFFKSVKNNEGIVYIDENVMELNYEQCVELYKWLQRVVSFVDNNKEIDMTKEQIEKELGHKINIVD